MLTISRIVHPTKSQPKLDHVKQPVSCGHVYIHMLRQTPVVTPTGFGLKSSKPRRLIRHQVGGWSRIKLSLKMACTHTHTHTYTHPASLHPDQQFHVACCQQFSIASSVQGFQAADAPVRFSWATRTHLMEPSSPTPDLKIGTVFRSNLETQTSDAPQWGVTGVGPKKQCENGIGLGAVFCTRDRSVNQL
jgi:hypothetical protein